jgi:hypothetical protein
MRRRRLDIGMNPSEQLAVPEEDVLEACGERELAEFGVAQSDES